MDYVKYLDLIEQGKKEEAKKYRKSKTPSRLYKYFSLKNAADSKLQYLKENKIFLSDFGGFNDPFEGRFFRFDDEKIKANKWNPQDVRRHYAEFCKMARYTCLSATNENNMPMWAYYADNHEGFCVEYNFTERQKKYIYPVSYEPYERPMANNVSMNLLYAYMKLSAEGKSVDDISSEIDMLMEMYIISLASKHSSWKHEAECRIIVANRHDFPAVASRIYIGLNCKEEHRRKLIEIGRTIEFCEVYQMTIDENSERFELKPVLCK